MIYILIINAFTFLLFGIDKKRAIEDKWRISEKALLAFAAAGGSVGAIMGMYTFRHKTRKPLFKYGLPIILVLQILALGIEI